MILLLDLFLLSLSLSLSLPLSTARITIAGAIMGSFNMSESSNYDWVIPSGRASENQESLELAEGLATQGEVVTRGDTDSEAAMWFIFSWDKPQSIFTPANVQTMCQLEQVFLQTDDYNHVCLLNATSGQCAEPVDSITYRFYGGTVNGPACPLLSDSSVNATASALYAALNDPNQRYSAGFFLEKETENRSPRFTTKTRSTIPLGSPLDGFSTKRDRESDQDVEKLSFYKKVRKNLFELLDMKGRFLFSAYRNEVSRNGVEIQFTSGPLFELEGNALIADDLMLAIGSMAFVFGWMCFHLRSGFLATVSITQVVLSVPVAIFIYRNVYQIYFFDSIHILVVFLVLGIGADDIFVFIDGWRQAKESVDGLKRQLDPQSYLDLRMIFAYEHTVAAVFNTSFTTVVAFLATAVSPIMPIATFGILAATAIVVNYIFVITITPAVVVCYHLWFEKKWCCCLEQPEEVAGRKSANVEKGQQQEIEGRRRVLPRSGSNSKQVHPGPAVREGRNDDGESSLEKEEHAKQNEKVLVDMEKGRGGGGAHGGGQNGGAATASVEMLELRGATTTDDISAALRAHGGETKEAWTTSGDRKRSSSSSSSYQDRSAIEEKKKDDDTNKQQQQHANNDDDDDDGDKNDNVRQRRLSTAATSNAFDTLVVRYYIPCMTFKAGGWLVVALAITLALLAYGLVSVVFATRLAPPEEPIDWFPDDHMLRVAQEAQENDFTAGSLDEYVRVRIPFGITGIRRPNFNPFKPAENRGEPVFDDAFDLFPAASQDAYISVCNAARTHRCDKPVCQPQLLVYPTGDALKCFLPEFQAWFATRNPGRSTYNCTRRQFMDELALYRNDTSTGLSSATKSEMIGFIDGDLKYVSIHIAATARIDAATVDMAEVRSVFDGFIFGQNDVNPPGMNNAFAASGTWVWVEAELGTVSGFYSGLMIVFPVAFFVLILATSNIILALYAIISIGLIVAGVLGFIQEYLGWSLGVAEAIAGIIVIGFSVDYVIHLGHMYVEAGLGQQAIAGCEGRFTYAAEKMVSTVIAGGITTFGAAIPLWFCQMTFFPKMGTLMALTIFFSLIYSVGFFMALSLVAGPVGRAGNLRWAAEHLGLARLFRCMFGEEGLGGDTTATSKVAMMMQPDEEKEQTGSQPKKKKQQQRSVMEAKTAVAGHDDDQEQQQQAPRSSLDNGFSDAEVAAAEV
eukprot:jgi/Bigna1/85675/estExt_fgenesh1_pg.C_50195